MRQAFSFSLTNRRFDSIQYSLTSDKFVDSFLGLQWVHCTRRCKYIQDFQHNVQHHSQRNPCASQICVLPMSSLQWVASPLHVTREMSHCFKMEKSLWSTFNELCCCIVIKRPTIKKSNFLFSHQGGAHLLIVVVFSHLCSDGCCCTYQDDEPKKRERYVL